MQGLPPATKHPPAEHTIQGGHDVTPPQWKRRELVSHWMATVGMKGSTVQSNAVPTHPDGSRIARQP